MDLALLEQIRSSVVRFGEAGAVQKRVATLHERNDPYISKINVKWVIEAIPFTSGRTLGSTLPISMSRRKHSSECSAAKCAADWFCQHEQRVSEQRQRQRAHAQPLS